MSFKDKFSNYDIPKITQGVRLPEFKIDPCYLEKYSLSETVSDYQFLLALSLIGLETKVGHSHPRFQEYQKRMNYELGVFKELGFCSYLLLTWEILNHCRENDIAVGAGRGCLDPDTKLLTSTGFKSINQFQVGDSVINRYGQVDYVTNVFKYPSPTHLVKIKTSANSCFTNRFTGDHEILCVDNPFSESEYKLDGKGFRYIENFSKINLAERLEYNKARWKKAKGILPGDYLVRYRGRLTEIQDIEKIDLAKFATEFDNDYVYEGVGINDNHPLAVRTIASATGLSRNFLNSVKRQYKVSSRRGISINKLELYLSNIGSSIKEFLDFVPRIRKKYPRFIDCNNDFCYLIGFYTGDGWRRESGCGFAFHSQDNLKELHRIKTVLDSYGCQPRESKHKKKNLIQLDVNSRIFSAMFESFSPGGQHDRYLVDSLMNLPDSKLKSLYDGLIDSDGHIGKHSKDCYDSISIRLAYQVSRIAEYFGNVTGITQRNQKGCNTSYKVEIYKRKTYRSSKFFINGDWIFVKVRDVDITIADNEFVYDLSIKNDPSFHTSDFIVHNSSAGSLICYLIGITDIDSLQYDLYFERFLSKTRAKFTEINGVRYYKGDLLLDVDVDVEGTQRQRLIEWFENKYLGRIAKLPNISTLTTKVLIHELVRIVLSLPNDDATRITGYIPVLYGKPKDIDTSIAESKEFAAFANSYPEVIEIARKLDGLCRHFSVHASAWVITNEPIDTVFPLQYSKDDGLVCGYTMDDALDMAIKVDLLGLDGVALVEKVCARVGINSKDIDLGSPQIYEHFKDFKYPEGCFQLSGDCNFGVVQKIKPRNLEELAAVVAIARPGALQFVDRFAKFVETGEKQSIHPFFDKILEKTGGLALFQEQMMQMVSALGFTLEAAETVRKIVGKKKIEEMAPWEKRVEEKIKEQNLDPEIGKILWKILDDSKNYSFNKCLSFDTVVETESGLKTIEDVHIGEKVLSFDVVSKTNVFTTIKNKYESTAELFEVEFTDGRTIKCSMDHELLCEDLVKRPLKTVLLEGFKVVTD